MNQGENSGEESGNGIDQDIAQPYRAGSAGMPSAAADAAILMLAREAAAQTPARTPIRAAATPTSALRRWRAPLGLAASLVLVVGIVSRVQLEEEAGKAPGAISAPSAPLAAQPAARAEAPAAPESQVKRKADAAASTAASTPAPFPAQGGGPAAAILDAAKPEPDSRAKSLADSTAPAAVAGARKESAPVLAREAEAMNRTMAPQPAPAASPAPAAPAQTEVGTNARGAASDSAGAAPTRAAAPLVTGEVRRDDMARARAPATAQGVAPLAAGLALTEQTEAALTPEQWLRRIIDARRAGRHDEADASLARFVLKHPAVAVPPEARRERP